MISNKIQIKKLPLLINTSTSAILPIINQAYTISKEGLHPGRAYKKENELKWAVPYKLDSWSFKPLKSDLHETFEGKEGYEKGGKEIKDATIDVMVKLPIKDEIKQEIIENLFGETLKKSIDLITKKDNNTNTSVDTNNKKNNKK